MNGLWAVGGVAVGLIGAIMHVTYSDGPAILHEWQVQYIGKNPIHSRKPQKHIGKCMYAYVCVYTYIYTQIYTHKHMYTHMY